MMLRCWLLPVPWAVRLGVFCFGIQAVQATRPLSPLSQAVLSSTRMRDVEDWISRAEARDRNTLNSCQGNSSPRRSAPPLLADLSLRSVQASGLDVEQILPARLAGRARPTCVEFCLKPPAGNT